MAATIAAQLAATPYSELSLVRKKGGVRGDITLTENMTAYASYSLEHREGARPFSMNEDNFWSKYPSLSITRLMISWRGCPSTASGLRSICARPPPFSATISRRWLFISVMQSAGPQGVVQHATFALAPSNEAYNIKGDIARDLPDFLKSKFTASVSYTTNRQNEKLLMPISAAENADLTAAGVTSLNGPTAGLASTANPGYSTAMDINNWNGVNGIR